MNTFIIVLLLTILTVVEARPVPKFEQNLTRHRRQNQINISSYQPNSTINNQQIISDIWNHIQPVFNDHINSHFDSSLKPGCKRITNDNIIINKGDFVEYCLEKILNQDGQSYSTKTSTILYKTDGTIIPLHQAESNIDIETYNHLN